MTTDNDKMLVEIRHECNVPKNSLIKQYGSIRKAIKFISQKRNERFKNKHFKGSEKLPALIRLAQKRLDWAELCLEHLRGFGGESFAYKTQREEVINLSAKLYKAYDFFGKRIHGG